MAFIFLLTLVFVSPHHTVSEERLLWMFFLRKSSILLNFALRLEKSSEKTSKQVINVSLGYLSRVPPQYRNRTLIIDYNSSRNIRNKSAITVATTTMTNDNLTCRQTFKIRCCWMHWDFQIFLSVVLIAVKVVKYLSLGLDDYQAYSSAPIPG